MEAYVCSLVQRYDPATKRERWSMPSALRCSCQGVMRNPGVCPAGGEHLREGEEYWYTDDYKSLVNRKNWQPHILNKLLERVEFCSKFHIDIERRLRSFAILFFHHGDLG